MSKWKAETEHEQLDPAAIEVRRLRAMRCYPREDAELVRVAREFSPAPHVLRAVITVALDDQDRCPQPADLKRMLLARTAPAPRPCCDLCAGSGFVESVYLVKRHRDEQTGRIWKQALKLTCDQAKRLELEGVTYDTFALQYLAKASEQCDHNHQKAAVGRKAERVA